MISKQIFVLSSW